MKEQIKKIKSPKAANRRETAVRFRPRMPELMSHRMQHDLTMLPAVASDLSFDKSL
jgi:hypothetical protein